MSVYVGGREWKEYTLEWKSMEGREFSTSIFALSPEHASYVLEDIKSTGVIGDEIVGRTGNIWNDDTTFK